MPIQHLCSVCNKVVVKANGVLHGLERPCGIVDHMEGFVFWKWDVDLADRCVEAELDACHTACIGAQVQKYMKHYNLGRLELPGARVVLTRKKMDAREKRALEQLLPNPRKMRSFSDGKRN